MVAPEYKTPMSRKHQVQGYLMTRAWEHVRENRDFLRELKKFSETHHPPVFARQRVSSSPSRRLEPARSRACRLPHRCRGFLPLLCEKLSEPH